jgi:hypothetical protein
LNVHWEKRGCIFEVDGQAPWMATHAQLPVPVVLDEYRLRVYFASRDGDGRARVGMFEADPAAPSSIVRLHDQPVLDLGPLGAFDANGVMPASVIERDGITHLYYIGWTREVTVPYRLAIGLAFSEDGVTFTRAYEGPVLDRSRDDAYFVTAPCVLREADAWRMWYVSTSRWLEVDGRPEPVYSIRYAESANGIEWDRTSERSLDDRLPEEAQGRPWVVHDRDTYRMWYCYRSVRGYRDDPEQSYRIGYAESTDGVTWDRRDDEAGISRSEKGWDSKMVAYPSVYTHAGRRHLLYNGNGFGTSGIGHAVGIE